MLMHTDTETKIIRDRKFAYEGRSIGNQWIYDSLKSRTLRNYYERK